MRWVSTWGVYLFSALVYGGIHIIQVDVYKARLHFIEESSQEFIWTSEVI